MASSADPFIRACHAVRQYMIEHPYPAARDSLCHIADHAAGRMLDESEMDKVLEHANAIEQPRTYMLRSACG